MSTPKKRRKKAVAKPSMHTQIWILQNELDAANATIRALDARIDALVSRNGTVWPPSDKPTWTCSGAASKPPLNHYFVM